MKPNSNNPIQTHYCPTLNEWRSFAAATGVPAAFYEGPAHLSVEQAVRVSVLSEGGQIIAIAPIFVDSLECGLWVAPEWRRKGIGAKLLDHVIRHDAALKASAVLATVAHDNPFGAYMLRILKTCGFSPFAGGPQLSVWRKRT